MSEEIQSIPINKIKLRVFNPRVRFDEEFLKELATSIKETGQWYPVLVHKATMGCISGESRILAAKLIGKETIDGKLLDIPEEEAYILSLDTNIKRRNLTALEEAIQLDKIMKKYGYKQRDLARKLDAAHEEAKQKWISRRLSLLRLDDKVKEYIETEGLTPTHARELVKIEDKELQRKVAEIIMEDNIGAGKPTEQLVRKIMIERKSPEMASYEILMDKVEKRRKQVIEFKKAEAPIEAIEITTELPITLYRYRTFGGSSKWLVQQVHDGSIIKRFEATPFPKDPMDIVCPHFLELKWATGCPYNCAWCYLQGTLRFMPEKKKPYIKKPYPEKVEAPVKAFLDLINYWKEYREGEILNTGEIADSLMWEARNPPFSKVVIPLFEQQKRVKVLFLTKSDNVKNLLEINPHNQVIISFSLNTDPVAKRWEKGAPSVGDRIKAARKVYDAGYEVRVRFDPLVPYPEDEWRTPERELVDAVFSEFTPERVTTGSLRGLQSTINEAKDKTWVDYVTEPSRWGRRIPFELRLETFQVIVEYLKEEYDYTHVALCKEPMRMWDSLGMDWRKCRCNCVW